MLCSHAIISNHRLLPGTRYQVLSGKSDEWMHLLPFYTRMHGELLRYATSTSQYSLACSLKVRDDWGSQRKSICSHDITSPFPPSANKGYICNRDVIDDTHEYIAHHHKGRISIHLRCSRSSFSKSI